MKEPENTSQQPITRRDFFSKTAEKVATVAVIPVSGGAIGAGVGALANAASTIDTSSQKHESLQEHNSDDHVFLSEKVGETVSVEARPFVREIIEAYLNQIKILQKGQKLEDQNLTRQKLEDGLPIGAGIGTGVGAVIAAVVEAPDDSALRRLIRSKVPGPNRGPWSLD